MLLQLFLSVLVTAAATDRGVGMVSGHNSQIYNRVYFQICRKTFPVEWADDRIGIGCWSPVRDPIMQLPYKEYECLLLYPSPHWWQLDTDRFTGFKVVRIYTTAIRNPLTELSVTVDEFDTCATRKFRAIYDYITFHCVAYGRYFRISSNLPMRLCKVKVWGDAPVVPEYKSNHRDCIQSKQRNDHVVSHAAGSEEACVMRALDSKLRYFNYTNGVCKVSKTPFGLTHYILTNLKGTGPSCREICVGNRQFCILQQRVQRTVAFNRSWAEYVRGFGDDNINIWAGLDWLHRWTSRPDKLVFRAELTDLSYRQYVAEYSWFVVHNASTNYTMDYGAFLSKSSTVNEDPLARNRMRQFSTMDRDNAKGTADCSLWQGGAGWWFAPGNGSWCDYASPNDLYFNRLPVVCNDTNFWYSARHSYLHMTRLLIQNVN